MHRIPGATADPEALGGGHGNQVQSARNSLIPSFVRVCNPDILYPFEPPQHLACP